MAMYSERNYTFNSLFWNQSFMYGLTTIRDSRTNNEDRHISVLSISAPHAFLFRASSRALDELTKGYILSYIGWFII